MTSLSNTSLSANGARSITPHHSNSSMPPPGTHEHGGRTSASESTLNRKRAWTWPATERLSHQPPEGSEMTMLGGIYDGGVFDDASSITLQDEFPWHQVGLDKYVHRMPSTIVPALLLGIGNAVPFSSSSLDKAEGGSREARKDASGSGDVPRYYTTEKGKWKAEMDDDVGRRGRSLSQLRFISFDNSDEDWVVHNKPVLQEYADRQISLPLGRRLEVSLDEPSNFILGSLQLLVNRDCKSCADPSRQLGPQLIENFVEINGWAKDYFRSRHGTQDVCSDVSMLLTIVMNNFYEGQVQLIDRLVEFALQHMNFRGGASLAVEDFAFGFDFRMSQDLPFYVETSSRIREPHPIRAVEVQSTPGPVTTHSGRQVKPTKRAQEASEQAQVNGSGRRNKGKRVPQVNDKQARTSSVPLARQAKGPAQAASNRTTPKTPLVAQAQHPIAASAPPGVSGTSERAKYRPVRPSSLGLPPGLPSPFSTSDNTRAHSGENSTSKPSVSASANSPKGTGSSGPKPTVPSLPRLKIVLPALKSRPCAASAISVTGSKSSDTSSSKSGITTRANARKTTDKGRGRSGGRGNHASGDEHKGGSGSLTSSAEMPESTSHDARAVKPDGAKNAAPALVSPSARSPTRIDAAGDASCGEQPHGANDSIGSRDDGPTSRSMRARGSLLWPSDPGSSQKKKRKMDDCEDYEQCVPELEVTATV